MVTHRLGSERGIIGPKLVVTGLYTYGMQVGGETQGVTGSQLLVYFPAFREQVGTCQGRVRRLCLFLSFVFVFFRLSFLSPDDFTVLKHIFCLHVR